jgi:hypothetical protein
MTRRDLEPMLTSDQGGPIVRFSWYPAVEDAIDDPTVRMVLISAMRQPGKTTKLKVEHLVHLLTVPNSYGIFLAAAETQSQSIFNTKFRRPFERLLDRLGVPRKSIIITKRSIEIPELNSKLEVLATDERTSPGRSVTLLSIDEAASVPDEVYTALAPSIIGANGKILLASSAGRPSGFFFQLLQHPRPERRIIRVTTNENPAADAELLTFLREDLALIDPSAARRHIDNIFCDDGNSFLPEALIADAVDDALEVLM